MIKIYDGTKMFSFEIGEGNEISQVKKGHFKSSRSKYRCCVVPAQKIRWSGASDATAASPKWRVRVALSMITRHFGSNLLEAGAEGLPERFCKRSGGSMVSVGEWGVVVADSKNKIVFGVPGELRQKGTVVFERELKCSCGTKLVEPTGVVDFAGSTVGLLFYTSREQVFAERTVWYG